MNPTLKKKIIFNILTAVCLSVTIAAAIYIASYIYRYFINQNMNQNIADLYENTIPEPPSDLVDSIDSSNINAQISVLPESAQEKENPMRTLLEFAEQEGRKRFTDFLAINENFQGMLIIEGLDIKLPYVHYTDNDKYLNTDFEGNSSSYGTVFLSYSNDRLLMDKNSVFFGHHLRSGAMFTPLLKYRDISTVSAAPVVTLDSLTGKTKWLVFAAYTCEPDYGYINTKVDGLEFADLLDEINSRSLFTTNVDVTEDDQIITLSTCAYDFQDARFAVHARKLRPGEKVPDITANANPDPKPYNVPMLLNLSELTANHIAIMRHPGSLKTYYYQIGNSGIEWYVGNTSQIQGPYNCYASEELDSDSVISAIYAPNGLTILAIDRFEGKPGITLLSSNSPGDIFTQIGKSPITPKDVDARYPLLTLNNNEINLLYTVAGEQDEIYRARISTGGAFSKPELILSAPKNLEPIPVGMIRTKEHTLFTWHEKSTKQLMGIWLDGTSDGALESISLPYSGSYDRITVYGSISNGRLRMMTEKNGMLYPGTFDLNQIPPPPEPIIAEPVTDIVGDGSETDIPETENVGDSMSEAENNAINEQAPVDNESTVPEAENETTGNPNNHTAE